MKLTSKRNIDKDFVGWVKSQNKSFISLDILTRYMRLVENNYILQLRTNEDYMLINELYEYLRSKFLFKYI